jgi:hypothetical protein
VVRRPLAAALFVALIAAVVAVLGVEEGWWSASTPPAPVMAIAAQGSISPQASQFGDVITAQAVVTLDPARIDVASVRLVPHFLSYRIASGARALSHSGGATWIAYSFALDCLGAGCAPGRPQVVLDFPNAALRYTTTSGHAGRLAVTWPEITVASRLDDADRADPAAHLRADTAPPPVSYDLSPGPLTIGLTAAAALLVLAAGALVLLAFRRRAAPVAATEAETDGSPLELALRLVRETASNGDQPELRRLALQRLVRELRASDAAALADAAGWLAWSDGAPAPGTAREFADRVENEVSEP